MRDSLSQISKPKFEIYSSYKAMLSYCLKNTEKMSLQSKNPKVSTAKNKKIILFSKYAVCNREIIKKRISKYLSKNKRQANC